MSFGLLPSAAFASDPDGGQDNSGAETPPDNAVTLTVNGATYNSFEEALYAASDMKYPDGTEDADLTEGSDAPEARSGEPLTFKLEHDITGTVTLTNGFTGYTIQQGKEVVLDLNGHKIEIKDQVPFDKNFVLFLNEGTFTVKDSKPGTGENNGGKILVSNGKAIPNSYSTATVIIRSTVNDIPTKKTAVNIQGGHLEIDSNYLTTDGAGNSGYIANLAYVIDAFENADVTMSGGTLKSDYHPVRLFIENAKGDITFNMTGGTIEQGRRMPLFGLQGVAYSIKADNVWQTFEIDISGGELYCPESPLFYHYGIEEQKSDITITGNTTIRSPGVWDTYVYYFDPNATGTAPTTEERPDKIHIDASVTIDPDYVTHYRGDDDLIDADAGGAVYATNEVPGIDLMFEYYSYAYPDEYENYYAGNLYFVKPAEDTTSFPDVYVFLQIPEEDELSELEQWYLEEVLGLQANSVTNKWYTVGKLPNVSIPQADEKYKEGNYYSAYETAIQQALSSGKIESHEDVNGEAAELVELMEWTKLHTDKGAAGYNDKLDINQYYWHLNGTLNPDFLSDLTMTIQPADITIYTGGEGYKGATDENGQELTTDHGLPEPGFHITLPEALDEWVRKQAEADGEDTAANLSDYLTFTYEVDGTTTREWTLKYQGVYSTDEDGNPEKYVYSLEPAEEQDPISMLYFEDADEDGELGEGEEAIDTDVINMADAPSKDYAMAINPNGLKLENVIAHFQMGDGETETLELKVETKAGKLTVKSVADPDTNPIVDNEGTVDAEAPTAVADDVKFYVNETQVEIEDTTRVGLLVDSVSNDDTFNQNMETDAIREVREDNASLASDAQAQSYYLDLVDTQNGNTVVTMGKDDKLTIHWPMPEDADPNGKFYVVHYDGMNRESVVNGEDLSSQRNHQETAKISDDGKYIIFETSTFSPFVLVYEKQTYTITASAGTGGTIAPDGVTTVTKGGSQTYTITANGGNWYISDVLVDGVSVGAKSTYTFSNVDANHTIEAKFVYIPPYIPPTEDPDPEPTPEPDPDLDYVPDGLNTTDHVAYLIGYEDGTIRPEADITRAEVATIFFRLLEDEVRDANWSTDSGFPDVNQGDWFNTAVSTLTGMDIIIGYEDGTFRPNEPITRAEFVTIATRFYDYTAEYEPGGFTDVDEDAWYADYIQAAVDMDLILGHGDGTFGPENPITRAEAAAIVNRMLGRRPHEDHLLSEEVMDTWVDNSNQDMWYYEDIQEATNTHTYEWIVVKDEPDEDYRTVECWQSKLPDPDWVEIEQGWAAAKG